MYPRIFLSLAALTFLVVGCASTPDAPIKPRAKPAGAGLALGDPKVSVAPGTTCSPDLALGIASRFKSAASGALSKAGFHVVDETAGGAAPYGAGLEIEVSYCSDAGIVSGSTALELKKGGASVWRSQATGDQARPETAASTMAELVDNMLDDPSVATMFAAAKL